jgi:EAL domain-containing protein (putative c-di-GMP-specific phosphodiesterase class I)
LCETIVELAKRFNLKTVAEGIEKSHESHKLQGIGCDIGQGYLFAKPMEKDRFVGLIARRITGAAKPPPPKRSGPATMFRGLFAES